MNDELKRRVANHVITLSEMARSGQSHAVSDMRERLREKFPEIWAKYNPKFYKKVDQFGNYELPSVVFANAEVAAMLQNTALSSQVFLKQCVTGEIWAAYGAPRFFVTKEILKAAMMTQPPDEVDWSTMKLPFESAVFIFPRGVLFFPDNEGECHMAMYTRTRKQIYQLPSAKWEVDYKTESFTINSFSSVHYYDYLSNFVAPYSPGIINNLEIEDDFQVRLTDSEAEFNGVLAKIVFNLLLIMNERPDILERGVKVGTHKKRRCEMWTPNVIGRRFVVRRETYGKSDLHPRMHWRRGHWRQQPFGTYKVEPEVRHVSVNETVVVKQRRVFKEFKNIWIEPMLVGGKDA